MNRSQTHHDVRDRDRLAVAELKLSLDSRVSALRLSPKERCALAAMCVQTVRELLELDLHRVLRLPRYDIPTYERLRRSRERAKAALHCEPDGDGGTAIRVQTRVEELGLSTRGARALRQLGAATVGEFLALDVSNVHRLPNCGAATRAELTNRQHELRDQLAASVPNSAAELAAPSIREMVQQPAVLQSWSRLPLFCEQPADGVTAADLHATYQPHATVEYIGLSKHVAKILAARKIASLGELLLTPGGQLLGSPGLGDLGLAAIQAVVDDLLRSGLQAAASGESDWPTGESFLSSVLGAVATDERQRIILLERMGWQPQKLAALGQQFGITRERVRQIEKKGWKRLAHWRAGIVLRPLYDLIRDMLQETSLLSLKAVARQLQRRFDWQQPLHENALAKLLPALGDLQCIDGRYVCDRTFKCPHCPVFPRLLEKLLTKRLSLSELTEQLAERLRATDACRGCAGIPAKAVPSLVRLVLRRDPAIRRRYHMDKDELWPVDEWRWSKCPLSVATEKTLREHPGPMSYQEVQTAVNRVRERKATLKQVWWALKTCVERQCDILLWDRGGVYQHKCHVNLQSPLLQKIEKWVLGTLRKGSFPQLSANAALMRFKAECRAAGLASPHAVCSCLKHRQHPKLAYFRSPYIGLAGETTRRIPNAEIAEELIRRKGGVVKRSALRKTLCDRMGMKDFQFARIIVDLQNVIRTERGYLHADYFDAASPIFADLVEYVRQKFTRQDAVSADLLYAETTALCQQLKIDGSRMLHSVLVQLAAEVVAAVPYPRLMPPSSGTAAVSGAVVERQDDS